MPEKLLNLLILPAGWACAYLAFVFAGRRAPGARRFREALLQSRKPALALALIFYFGAFLGTFEPKYLLNVPETVLIFCVASFGLALAKPIEGFEPLRVTAAVARRQKPAREILLALAFALLLVLFNIVISNSGIFGLCLRVFHETNGEAAAMQAIPGANRALAFFTLLAGAGVAEEVVYRLFFLTLFLRLLKKPWAAVALSAVCFGLYHLTPMDSLYRTYWEFPVAQAVSAALSGLAFGFVYEKRGLESSVLGHTLTDWLGVLLMK